MKRSLAILLLALSPSVAQAEEEHEHDHGFELGTMFGPTYIVEDDHWTAGLHIHGVWFIPDTPMGLGVGYERLMGEHSHNTLSMVYHFHVWNGFSLALAPGISFGDEVSPAFHIETAYSIEDENLCVGPSFEVAIDMHTVHITPGLHLGVLF